MLQHKIVAVTGASSGIGALIAQRLSAEGAYVILIGRSEERLQEVSKRMPGPHEIAMMDVRDDEQVQAIFKAALAKHGKIDVLINNAGYGKFSPFWICR